MPSKVDKQLKKLRQTKTGWRTNDLKPLYEYYGFNVRSGTKHYIITHPDFPEIRDMLPHSTSELSPDYARDALKSIEKVISYSEEKVEKDQENE